MEMDGHIWRFFGPNMVMYGDIGPYIGTDFLGTIHGELWRYGMLNGISTNQTTVGYTLFLFISTIKIIGQEGFHDLIMESGKNSRWRCRAFFWTL